MLNRFGRSLWEAKKLKSDSLESLSLKKIKPKIKITKIISHLFRQHVLTMYVVKLYDQKSHLKTEYLSSQLRCRRHNWVHGYLRGKSEEQTWEYSDVHLKIIAFWGVPWFPGMQTGVAVTECHLFYHNCYAFYFVDHMSTFLNWYSL
jgi:hypothetical protein